MVSALPRSLGQAVWPIMVSALVGLAIYVSGGGLLLSALPRFQADIEDLLSQRISGKVTAEAISGTMDGFSPRLSLSQFVLREETGKEWIRLPEVSLRIDPWQSLVSGALRFDELTLISPRIEWVAGEAGAPPELSLGAKGLLNGFTRLQIREAEIVLPAALATSDHEAIALSLDLDLVRDRSERTVTISIEHAGNAVLSASGSGTGNPFEFNQFSGEAYGHISGQGASLVAQWLGQDVTVEGSSDFWLSVTGGKPRAILQTQIEGLALGSAGHVNIDRVDVHLEASGPLDDAELWVSDSVLSAGDNVLALPRAHISRQGAGWQVLTEAWDAAQAADFIANSGILPATAGDIVSALAPRGTVERLMLSVDSLQAPMVSWEGAAVVTDATTEPFRKVPGLSGIDASITANQDGARAWVITRDFALVLPEVYEAPIQLEEVIGQLSGRWQRGALFLEQGVFAASASDHDARVQFEIDIPLSKPAPIPLEMRLAAAVETAPVSARNVYIPYRLPPPAYQWLRSALPRGEVDQATFLWHGGFKPFGHPGQTLQLAAVLSDVELDYQGGWPVARFEDAQLQMSDRDIIVAASRAELAEISASDVDVHLHVGAAKTGFELTAQSADQPSDLLDTLKQLPALTMADAVMRDLTVGGDQFAQTQMALAFDLRDISNTLDVAVDVDLADAQVNSALLDLAATEVTGALRYRTETGFETQDLTAKLFGRRVAVVMGPELAATPDTILAAQIDTEVSVTDLLSWQDVSLTLPAKGTAPVVIDVNVADKIDVVIRSDLQGIEVDLPLPWGKPAETTAPLQIVWQDRDWAAWEIFWFGRLTAVADVPALGALSTTVDLTPRTRPPQSAVIAPSPGLTVTGFIPSLDLADWRSQDLTRLGGGAISPSKTRIDNLRIGRLLWQGDELGELNFSLDSVGDSLTVQFDLPWLSGGFSQGRAVPVTESDAGLTAALTRRLDVALIDLDGLPPLSDQLADPSPPDPDRGVGQWMRGLPVTVAEIRRGDLDLGDVALRIEYAEAEGWQFQEINGDFLGITWLPDTHIVWRDRGSESTTLTLSAELNDIAKSLALIGVAPILETRGGNVEAQWQWPGGPADFELNAVKGDLDLEMRSGSFLSANAEATGAMRLLSLLNLSGLFRRANMNQLFDPGVTFDRAGGRFELDAGLMRIPGFSIDGSGGYFNFTSDINLLEETLDGELVVTLPLVENIPWLAALAGGLPVAAGAYLASKVFEDQVNQLSSGVYSVSGNLSEPVVVFERVFDAKARSPGTVSQDTSLSD